MSFYFLCVYLSCSDQLSLLDLQASLFNQKLPAYNTGFLLQVKAYA